MRAERRLGDTPTSRRRRRDRGRSRLAPELLAKLDELLQGQERPPVRKLMQFDAVSIAGQKYKFKPRH